MQHGRWLARGKEEEARQAKDSLLPSFAAVDPRGNVEPLFQLP